MIWTTVFISCDNCGFDGVYDPPQQQAIARWQEAGHHHTRTHTLCNACVIDQQAQKARTDGTASGTLPRHGGARRCPHGCRTPLRWVDDAWHCQTCDSEWHAHTINEEGLS